jgi:hypothetical protein
MTNAALSSHKDVYLMPHGAATKLREVVDEIQKPDEPLPGKLFDPSGHTVHPVKRGLMARIDEKGSESVTLRKSTLWFIGTALVLFQVLFNYGGSIIGWARDDQSQKEQMTTMKNQVDETRNDVKELKTQFTELGKILQSQAVKDAEARGYKLGQTDAGASGHKEK